MQSTSMNTLTMYTLVQRVDGGVHCVLQPMLIPEYSRFILMPESKSEVGAPAQYIERVEELVSAIPLDRRFRFALDRKPDLRKVQLAISPPDSLRRGEVWIEPIQAEFDYAVWFANADTPMAFVPSLGIHVFLTDPSKPKVIREMVAKAIRNALHRTKAMGSLKDLAARLRRSETKLLQIDAEFPVRSPREEEERKRHSDPANEILKKVADRIGTDQAGKLFHYEAELEKLRSVLFASQPESVLLVGPAGVGKTQLVFELAGGKQKTEVCFWESSGSRIVAGMSGFGQWQQRCQDIVDELKGQRAVLFLGSLFELAHVGKSVGQKTGIATFLRPYIERGQILVIAECLPEQLILLEKEDPQLIDAFRKQDVNPPTETVLMEILKSTADAHNRKQTVAPAALQVIQQLHDRFAKYSDRPGRPIAFLKSLIDEKFQGWQRSEESDSVPMIEPEDVLKKFSSDSGLPYFLLSQRHRLDIAQTIEKFSSRVMGQDEPVRMVVDMLATVKANLTPAGKPIASFLFIGPTGVGKTEMAKSIAEFMFGDSQQMIRFDMSEYSNSVSIDRLIGDGVRSGLLTGKVRQSPFSVLLLDEFEKAHSRFFDLLLQVLGEGRLTDSNGRVTDFSTTIIVMTSNLGAESMSRQSFGFTSGADSEETSRVELKNYFTSEVQKFVRPEFFNRIDKVVAFDALDHQVIERVAKRELDQLRLREGIRYRDLNLEIDPSVYHWIARRGHDPRFGARPIQRFIQTEIVSPISNQLIEHPGDSVFQITASVVDDLLDLNVRVEQKRNGSKAKLISNSKPQEFASSVNQLRHARRRAQALFHCSLVKRLKNDHFRLDERVLSLRKRVRRLARNESKLSEVEKLNKELWEKELLLQKYQRINGCIDALYEKAMNYEAKSLLSLYDNNIQPDDQLQENGDRLVEEIGNVLLELYLLDYNDSSSVTMILLGRKPDLIAEMVAGYMKVANERELKSSLFLLVRSNSDRIVNEHAGSTLKMYRELTTAEWTAEKMDEARRDLFYAELQSGHPQRQSDALATLVKTDPHSLHSANAWPIEFDELAQQESQSDVLGVALRFKGRIAFPLLIQERGVHRFKGEQNDHVAVEVGGEPLGRHLMPHEIRQNGPYHRFESCRTYHRENHLLFDNRCGTLIMNSVTEGIADAVLIHLRIRLDMILDPLIETEDLLPNHDAAVVITN